MEHYILERRYRALFLAVRNFHISNAIQNNAGVTPRGVVYTLRSVLRGSSILNAHFTVYLYTSTWVFLCLFIASVVEDREQKQADASTHVFSYAVIKK